MIAYGLRINSSDCQEVITDHIKLLYYAPKFRSPLDAFSVLPENLSHNFFFYYLKRKRTATILYRSLECFLM